MAVLSDGEIRRLMRAGGLIDGGDLARASECSYSFVPGAAFLPGDLEPPIEFPGLYGQAEVIVRPSQMIWIRTLERVRIPDDLVGFWWQTNGLSRKGLMLVNMSMVEPGYQGDLACLFVNFGRSNVIINPETIIAKMVFQDLRGRLIHPYRRTFSRGDYDHQLRELALQLPKSFLQVGDLMTDLTAARTDAMAAIRQAGIDQTAATKTAMASARDDALTDFKNDIPKAVRGSFFWAVGAIALLTAATLGADKIKGVLFPDTKAVAQAAADEALKNRMTISAAPLSADDVALHAQIDALNKRLDKLDKPK
jgi:deoxycytidine triphosphate deaminase